MDEINFKLIEDKWQKRWKDSNIFEVKENSEKKKFYVLEMFPYPSGSGLHMGHAWNYVIGDIVARFKLMNGFEVLHPMGYDSLGLPAENAAIKEKIHPKDYTENSMNNFMNQQKALGLSYDWSRLVVTSDPNYYKWDQWIFLKMLEKNLAYRKESNVNWCPSCKTVLANEQAQTGNCDRCGSKVQIKKLKQWFLKITDYADELYENLNKMDWPERTKLMQRNWIGKSFGVEIDFQINGKKWPVFTTRPDTIFGVTFMVVSAQHPNLDDLVTYDRKEIIEEFLESLKTVSEKDLADMEKQGVFTGSYAINPATGEEVPVYAGNFVVADYGSGMVMAVPAHDQRDFEFAKKYKIKIKQVIEGNLDDFRAITNQGKLINSGKFDGLNNEEAKRKINAWLGNKGIAREVINFKLRDWGISRQRYWGTPIPIIYCPNCGAVPVPEEDLPVILPDKVEFGEGNPLETNKDWIRADCPNCGKEGKRETDTMDTFVNSSWYFMRYCDPRNSLKIFDSNKVKNWCPVDIYIGGPEHACMHLIYSRFYTKFLRDIGLINFDEPAKKLFHQGMLHASGGERMSKSKGNVVLPESVSDKYGIDTARFFLCSLASPDKDIDWNEKGIIGSLRFIRKIFDLYENPKLGNSSDYLENKMNKTIKNVGQYYGNFEYRKATIELRDFFEEMEKGEISKKILDNFLKLLNPICPHITEELWERLGNKGFISNSPWPEFRIIKPQNSKQDFSLNAKILNILKDNEIKENFKEIFIYVVPSDKDKINLEKLEKDLNLRVSVYSVNDKEKYDPKNKSKKSKLGMPSFWLE